MFIHATNRHRKVTDDMLLLVKCEGSNTSDKPQDNLEIWDVRTGQLVHSFLQRKQRDWSAAFIHILFFVVIGQLLSFTFDSLLGLVCYFYSHSVLCCD